jgi:hypothetical protein
LAFGFFLSTRAFVDHSSQPRAYESYSPSFPPRPPKFGAGALALARARGGGGSDDDGEDDDDARSRSSRDRRQRPARRRPAAWRPVIYRVVIVRVPKLLRHGHSGCFARRFRRNTKRNRPGRCPSPLSLFSFPSSSPRCLDLDFLKRQKLCASSDAGALSLSHLF